MLWKWVNLGFRVQGLQNARAMIEVSYQWSTTAYQISTWCLFSLWTGFCVLVLLPFFQAYPYNTFHIPLWKKLLKPLRVTMVWQKQIKRSLLTAKGIWFSPLSLPLPSPSPSPTCIITVDFYESNNVRVTSLPHKCKLINGRSLTRCKGLELGLC